MSPDQFIDGIVEGVVEENDSTYRRLFIGTTKEEASDRYWVEALTLFSALDASQREIFFNVIRQVVVDTTSNLLGIVDGVTSVGDHVGRFHLIDSEGTELAGDLQDIFLARIES